MPLYRNKFNHGTRTSEPPITAQQWNKPGDVPQWAFGLVKESADSIEVQNGMDTVIGKPGDYLSVDEPNKVWLIRKAYFEGKYELIPDVLTQKTDVERYASGHEKLKNFIPPREGYMLVNMGTLSSQPYHISSLLIFCDQLFAASDKGLLRFDKDKNMMVHIPFEETVDTSGITFGKTKVIP